MIQHRAAIIGLGIMGRRMVGNFEKHPLFQIVGVWDPSEQSISKTKQDYPSVSFAKDAEELIDNKKIDLLYIACPPEFHKQYALMAVEQKIAIYLEKPLGVDIAASEDLVLTLQKNNTPNIVNFVQASCEALEIIQNELKSGNVGTITGIDILMQYQQWPRSWQVEADWLRFKSAGGYTREVLSHFIFVTERLLGPTKIVFSNPLYPETDDLCETHIQARLACGSIPINIFGSCGGIGPDRQEITIWGTEKSYRISDFYFLETATDLTWQGALKSDDDPRTTTLQRQLDNVDRWLTGHPHPLASAADALSVQIIIEKMLSS